MGLRNHYFLDAKHTICYTYIRKNACSVFKRMILSRAPSKYRDAGLNPQQIMYQSSAASLPQAAGCEKRIFVLRDPVERVISGYLNQFIQKAAETDGAVARSIAAAPGLDPASVTFEQFVDQYLGRLEFGQINSHFHPVVSHLVRLNYTDVMVDKHLHQDATDILGRKRADRYFSRKINSTDKARAVDIPKAATLPAAELMRMYQDDNLLPSKPSLTTPELRDRLQDIYRADQTIYEDYMRRRTENGNRPVNVDMTDFDFSAVFTLSPDLVLPPASAT